MVYAQSALGAYSTVHNVLADKAAVLPDAISFEQAAASFLKGLTVWYLLRKTYEIKPDEMFLFHAAAGGVGLIACQWAKALGAKLIGTVGSSQKAQRAKEAGAWQVINYREESIVERLKALTDGRKWPSSTTRWGKIREASLDCLQRRGLMVSFGNSSGPVTGVNLGILNQKGSLYVTRPSLQGYITNREELEEACSELFSLIASGVIKVDVAESQIYPLSEARRAHESSGEPGDAGFEFAAAISWQKGQSLGLPPGSPYFFSSAVCRVQRDEFVNALIVTDLRSNAYAVVCKIVQVVTHPSIP